MAETATKLNLVWYTRDEFEERVLSAPNEVQAYLDRSGVTWLHVSSLADSDLIQAVGQIFKVHPLALEDVLTGQQRPKAEEYENHDFVILQHVRETPDHHLEFVQLSLFVGPNYVLSLQSGETDLTEPVRARIRGARGAVRQHGVDHLMYALLDAVIDGYFPLLEEFGEYLEFIQDETLLSNQPGTMSAIQRAKHQLLALRRAIWPMRDLLNVLMRDDNENITPAVKHYLRDCYDHVVMLIDTVETYREMASDLMDAYMSAVSNRLNSVMKILTVIATIFMPMTFIAGVYGMNFRTDAGPWNMPELTWRYGYLGFWLAMVLIGIGMFLYFRRLGWISASDLPTTTEDERATLLRQRLKNHSSPHRPRP